MLRNPTFVFTVVAASLSVSFVGGCGGGWFVSTPTAVPIIFDTDIGTDVDDAGALAILHVLADRGEANLLATMSANQNHWSAPAIDVINTYYGRGDMPIGSSRTGPNPEEWYHDSVSDYPHDLASGNDAPEAVELYRKILAAQPDNSITIVVVGWLTNIADLLNSKPDRYSPLNGRDLVDAKVKELVSMGGVWPNTKKEGDYNFRMDGAAAHQVIGHWPGKIVFSGLGIDVMTGARLVAQGPKDNPVLAFYRSFFEGHKVTERSSWDLIAVLYAVRGLSNYFTVVSDGKCVSREDGSNEWIPGPAGNHAYLVYRMSQTDLAEVIEDLMLAPPAARTLPAAARNNRDSLDVEVAKAEFSSEAEETLEVVEVSGALSATTTAETSHSGLCPLAVSPDGHFLMKADGTPFFWLGDTAWCLFTRPPEEVRLYLEDRAAKGFTGIQVMAIRTDLTTRELWENYRGDSPFDGLDPPRFNERYWRHLDFIVDEAARNRLYVVLFGMWGRDVSRLFHDPPRDNYDYGYALARRYRDRSNVLWSVCGEYEKIREDWKTNSLITDAQRNQIRRLAAGLDAGRARHNLMTIHPIFTSSRDFHDDSWLDFNMQQTWGHIAPNIRRIGEDFRRVPTKPVLNGEPGYENPPQGDCPAWHLRLEGYWSVFSGAFGFTYGAHKAWEFEPEWKEALDYPGSSQMLHLRALMESRPCLNRIPDPSILTSDGGSMNKENPTHSVATRAADGSFLFAYTPQGHGFEVDMTKLSGPQANAWWYNPRDGLCYSPAGRPGKHPFGTYRTEGRRRFSPPGSPGKGRDWVLVLESATGAPTDIGVARPGISRRV